MVLVDLDQNNLKKSTGIEIGIFNHSKAELCLTDEDLQKITEILHKKLKKQLDIIFLDSDASGNIDLAFAARENAKLLISFQERYSPKVVNYSKVLNLTKSGHISPKEFGKNIVKSIGEKSPKENKYSVSLLNLSEINLSFLDAFNQIFSSLALIVSKRSCFLEYIIQARKDSVGLKNKIFIDFILFLLKLIDKIRAIDCSYDYTLDILENNLKSAYKLTESLIIFHKANFDTRGISIYFPESGLSYTNYDYNTSWARATHWPDFLLHLGNALKTALNFKRG